MVSTRRLKMSPSLWLTGSNLILLIYVIARGVKSGDLSGGRQLLEPNRIFIKPRQPK